MFTIPVYLSAANSIINPSEKNIKVTVSGGTIETVAGSGIGPLNTLKEASFSAYDVIMSVAIQEMFHLTLACNISNALGIRPTITAPDLNNPPSCLSGIKGMPVKGNLSTLIDTMLAIEAPDPKYSYDETPQDPFSPKEPTLYQEEYDSIGDLYHALAYGVEQLWDQLYSPTNDAYQKLNFQGAYAVKQDIQTLNDAWNAMASITEEGEGNGVGGFMPSAYVPNKGQEYQEIDEVSHWERFHDIKVFFDGGGVIAQYEATNSEIVDPAQLNLTETYSKVINQLNEDFSKANTPLNLRGMSETGALSLAVWQGGKAPEWNYIPSPTPWPAIPTDAHVCQGLNMCKGQGYNNSGTGPGDGACATVEQSCSSSNDCKGLGACGFASTGQIPTPGQNDCSGQGGCQSPISPNQYYGPSVEKYNGQSVWEVARELFEQKYDANNPGKKLLPVGPVTQRRIQETPTSPKS